MIDEPEPPLEPQSPVAEPSAVPPPSEIAAPREVEAGVAPEPDARPAAPSREPASSPAGGPVLPRPALAFLAGAVSVALALGIQHLRHGWPFSLHHGMAVESAGASTEPHAAHPAERETTGARVAIDLDEGRLGALGVATTPVTREALSGELRTVATVVPDESRVSHVHTRVSGWVERLSVTTTGESVRSGQVLGAIFSRELLASQTEYVAALRAGPTSPLVRGGRDRLRVLGMTDAEIDALARRGEPLRNVPIVSPRAGVILHRGVTRGAAVDPSTELFVIADLSLVWVFAEVPESRMAEVAVGTTATLELASSGVEARPASVDFVYPTLTEGTRTLRVRFVVENRDGTIRPGAFGAATFHLEPRTALVVPRDAVVDHGTARYVFVAVGGGRFEPRPVEIGGRFEDRIEILEGLSEGERVVSSGVFLLDSESRLRASGGSMAGHAGHGGSSTDRAQTGGQGTQPVTAPSGAGEPGAPRPGGEHAGHGGGPAP